ncbi:MAG: CPCC family cysteine-rich protein [Syntrophomonas sp.]
MSRLVLKGDASRCIGGDDEIINSAKYPCPGCGNYTFEVEPSGSLEICDVCFWEDDRCRYHLAEIKTRPGGKEPNPKRIYPDKVPGSRLD